MNDNPREFICPICMDTDHAEFNIFEFNQEPSPCRHRFCMPCMVRHMFTCREAQNWSAKESSVFCPLCRQEYPGLFIWDFCQIFEVGIIPPPINGVGEDEKSEEGKDESASTTGSVISIRSSSDDESEDDSSSSEEDADDDSSYIPSDVSQVEEQPEIIDLTTDSD